MISCSNFLYREGSTTLDKFISVEAIVYLSAQGVDAAMLQFCVLELCGETQGADYRSAQMHVTTFSLPCSWRKATISFQIVYWVLLLGIPAPTDSQRHLMNCLLDQLSLKDRSHEEIYQ